MIKTTKCGLNIGLSEKHFDQINTNKLKALIIVMILVMTSPITFIELLWIYVISTEFRVWKKLLLACINFLTIKKKFTINKWYCQIHIFRDYQLYSRVSFLCVMAHNNKVTNLFFVCKTHNIKVMGRIGGNYLWQKTLFRDNVFWKRDRDV